MIFPIDINKRIANKRRIAGDNLIQLITTIAVVGNFFGIMVINWLVQSFLGGGLGLSLVILLAIDVFAAVFVFRFFIFDENAKAAEYMNADSDSFAKYMNVRKDFSHKIDLGGKKVSIIEFANGSASCTLEFRYGSNDNEKSRQTNEVFRQMFKTAALFGFEARACVMSEDFSKSNEFENYSRIINAIPEQKLKDAMTVASSAVLKYSEEHCNVDCIRFTVRSMTNYSRAEIETVLKKILSIIQENYTAFRSVKVLDIESMLEFYREFYGIAAIDLSMMKTIELSDSFNEAYNRVVSVYGIETTDGEFYSSKSVKEEDE